ncbi:unnamed protein product [Nesidiocoris tenuis]|uniref:C2H2-type domain-containing protein n=1 Tax=Nesidiocoris tenuis TaxID=355587 RepID=A0A6H5HB34_9HEMI|nr:unnamed protein product [Nesidiocoris tenuis]
MENRRNAIFANAAAVTPARTIWCGTKDWSAAKNPNSTVQSVTKNSDEGVNSGIIVNRNIKSTSLKFEYHRCGHEQFIHGPDSNNDDWNFPVWRSCKREVSIRFSFPELDNSKCNYSALTAQGPEHRFYCNCGRSYRRKADLHFHQRLECGAKGRFYCGCGRSYGRKDVLTRHQKLECGKEPQFKCHLCPYKAKQKFNLRNHLISKHESVYLANDPFSVRSETAKLQSRPGGDACLCDGSILSNPVRKINDFFKYHTLLMLYIWSDGSTAHVESIMRKKAIYRHIKDMNVEKSLSSSALYVPTGRNRSRT